MKQDKKLYEKPGLREIKLDSRETLGLSCHSSSANAILNACSEPPFSPCDNTSVSP